MPDFDIDFCQERRDEVITYVQQRYGRDRVAQIITFGTLQARAVLRDVGRVLQLPLGQVDRLAKMVPANPANPVTLAKAIEIEPRLRQARDEDEAVARLLDIALQLEGLYRNASTHAAGVVISDRPADPALAALPRPRAPSCPPPSFNMKWVESAGLVKFDFLGLKTLTVIRRAMKQLEKRGAAFPAGEPAARQRRGLRGHGGRSDGRGVPDGRAGDARHPAPAAPHLAGRVHGADLALPAGGRWTPSRPMST